MSRVRFGRVWLPVLAVVALGLVGCSEQTPGQASAGDTATQAPGSSTSAAPSESNSGGDPLAEFDYCTLLSDGDLDQLELRAGAPADATDRPNCRWKTKQAAGGYVIGVVYLDNTGVDEIPNADDEPVPTTVGEHEGVKFRSAAGGNSVIALEITDSSYVRILATTSLGVEKQDALAEQYAQLFEQRLPEGG
ncbi:uncharacterized protein DUF3558 [Tamaricihabitans halophyticus]|uniref:Uncharacterized protein DUF3558 n=1 Tax=Tamaricihabitans halophyticus TaxID=1262583 RepID=A0A4R2QXS3_9PSEU|nr:DUF3558 domain-containing protein [Tamaricihabitans halophyticus]TCP54164.1 uncharacterized protein DUF3558 [Tamaricihabitans halophyticus]